MRTSEPRALDDVKSDGTGNTGHVYPFVQLMYKAAPVITASHSDAFREAALIDFAWQGTVIAAKVHYPPMIS